MFGCNEGIADFLMAWRVGEALEISRLHLRHSGSHESLNRTAICGYGFVRS
jgi:hypothetical protein